MITQERTKDWVVDVNDSVTHGPFSYEEAKQASRAFLLVDGVTDVFLRKARDEERAKEN